MKTENHEDIPGNNLARNTNSPRIQEIWITQISEKSEARVREKVFQAFSKTDSRRLYSEPKISSSLPNRSVDIPELKSKKPGNEWPQPPEWSLS